LYEGEIVFVVDVVSGFNTAKVLKPGEEALYFPSSLVAAKSSSILSSSYRYYVLIRITHLLLN